METKTDQLILEMQKIQALFLAYANSTLTKEQKEKFNEQILESNLFNVREN